jgi:hypothetical protein
MKIGTLCKIGKVEYSIALPKKYLWDEAQSKEWPDGWYLPGPEELWRLYHKNFEARDGNTYWTSLRFDDEYSWIVNFYSGGAIFARRNTPHNIRLVRGVMKKHERN